MFDHSITLRFYFSEHVENERWRDRERKRGRERREYS